jgi:hypothetical protein
VVFDEVDPVEGLEHGTKHAKRLPQGLVQTAISSINDVRSHYKF